MSHDRGCPCGKEKPYTDCTDPDCTRKDRTVRILRSEQRKTDGKYNLHLSDGKVLYGVDLDSAVLEPTLNAEDSDSHSVVGTIKEWHEAVHGNSDSVEGFKVVCDTPPVPDVPLLRADFIVDFDLPNKQLPTRIRDPQGPEQERLLGFLDDTPAPGYTWVSPHGLPTENQTLKTRRTENIDLRVGLDPNFTVKDYVEKAMTPPQRHPNFTGRAASARAAFMAWMIERGSYRIIPRTDADGTRRYIIRFYLFDFKVFSGFLHNVWLSDRDDLHDHPWPNISIPLSVGFWEHYLDGTQRFLKAFSITFRGARSFHKLELIKGTEGKVWSLFLHFRRWRTWGFLHQGKWLDFKTYGTVVTNQDIPSATEDDYKVTGIFFPRVSFPGGVRPLTQHINPDFYNPKV